MIKLLGIASINPQVGKTTICEYIKIKYNYLHIEISEAVSYIARDFLGYNGNKSNMYEREKLQEIGYLLKKFYPDIWIYHTINLLEIKDAGETYIYRKEYPSTCFSFFEYQKIKKEIRTMGIKNFTNYYLNGKNIVIGGIRSIAEAEEIKKLNGKIILVKRENKEINNHPVENELIGYNNFDFIIENNKTIKDLYQEIDRFLKNEK